MKIRSNLLEYYTLFLIVVGIPLIGFIYVDWKLAVALCVGVQSLLGVTAAIRGNL